MFLPLFIAILLGLVSPSASNSNNSNNSMSTYDDGPQTPPSDNGGETGHIPIKK